LSLQISQGREQPQVATLRRRFAEAGRGVLAPGHIQESDHPQQGGEAAGIEEAHQRGAEGAVEEVDLSGHPPGQDGEGKRAVEGGTGGVGREEDQAGVRRDEAVAEGGDGGVGDADQQGGQDEVRQPDAAPSDQTR
jgi:hypothetical protein